MALSGTGVNTYAFLRMLETPGIYERLIKR